MTFPISAFRPESFSVVQLALSDGNTNQANATGFYVKFGNSYFLVTAKHALLGLSGFGSESYAARRWIPRFISTNCFRLSGNVLENMGIDECLYGQNGEPIWRENPDWDVAVIDITERVCANDFEPIAIDLSEVELKLDDEGNPEHVASDLKLPPVAEEVFIVGYPKGLPILAKGGLPVWKRGSIATEPHLRLNDLPIFLVDMLGREGLSGAPILYRGTHLVYPDGRSHQRSDDSNGLRLIGIYVGREGLSEGDHLSLGRAFKRSAIQDTIFYRPPEMENDNV